MRRVWEMRPFGFVLLLGNNIYGSDSPRDYVVKFETPYKSLLAAGVRFYAVLGNHDNPTQRHYPAFSMGGQRYYSFQTPEVNARFIGLDTNYADSEQLKFLEQELAKPEGIKICFFHHPLYSSARTHGPSLEVRSLLEPLFVRYQVTLGLSSHDAVYERIKPQKGVHYFVVGSGGRLRRGDLAPTSLTLTGYDESGAFVLFGISDRALHFATITEEGKIVETGTIKPMGR